EADGSERPLRRVAQFSGHRPRPANLPPMTKQHRVDDRDRKAPFDLGALGQIGYPAAAEPSPLDEALGWRQQADDPFQQSGLPRSVGADDCSQGASRQGAAEVTDR